MNTLIWYIENILRHLVQMLPCMTLALIIWTVVRPMRLRHLARRGWYSPEWREAALMAYILFCAGLCALTIFPYGFWEEYLKLLSDPGYQPDIRFPSLEAGMIALQELPHSITPFREILRVSHGGPWLWFVLWGNIGMFAPVGFGLAMLWNQRKWYHALFVGGIFSFTIELIQVFAGRVSDIDDVILNTTGTLLGFILYRLSCKVISLDWNRFYCQKKETA